MKLKFNLKSAVVVAATILFAGNVSGQSENFYYDGEVHGAKGIIDQSAGYSVSTGGVKKKCDSASVSYAYVLRTYIGGGMPAPAVCVGDGIHDYVGTDIKKAYDNAYYVVGYTTKEQLFPGIWDPASGTLSPYYNAFISLVDIAQPGNSWTRVFGDPNLNDMATAVSVDPMSNAWVTGIAKEMAPCKGGGNLYCSPNCYPTGRMMFVEYALNGTPVMQFSAQPANTNWAKGNDIHFNNGSVYVALTTSNSTCTVPYTTAGAIFVYNTLSITTIYKNLQGSMGRTTGNGLCDDLQGNMMMVGDISDLGMGYLWHLDAVLNSLSFNQFTSMGAASWNFKGVCIDTLCPYDSTPPFDSLRYTVLVSGDDNTGNGPLSHMFALRVPVASLTSGLVATGTYGRYMHRYSMNANIKPVRFCGDVFQTLDFAVFGTSHDAYLNSENSYIATINRGLFSGCEDRSQFYYMNVPPLEQYNPLNRDSLVLLDTVHQATQGMYEQKICEFWFRPATPSSENIQTPIETGMKSAAQGSVSVYPNPAGNSISVKSLVPFQDTKITLLDNTGKTVQAVSLENSSNSTVIDIKKLAPGIYYLSVYSQGRLIHSEKLVKQD